MNVIRHFLDIFHKSTLWCFSVYLLWHDSAKFSMLLDSLLLCYICVTSVLLLWRYFCEYKCVTIGPIVVFFWLLTRKLQHNNDNVEQKIETKLAICICMNYRWNVESLFLWSLCKCHLSDDLGREEIINMSKHLSTAAPGHGASIIRELQSFCILYCCPLCIIHGGFVIQFLPQFCLELILPRGDDRTSGGVGQNWQCLYLTKRKKANVYFCLFTKRKHGIESKQSRFDNVFIIQNAKRNHSIFLKWGLPTSNQALGSVITRKQIGTGEGKVFHFYCL